MNAGYKGAVVLGVTGFYNDPQMQWAGIAAAGVSFIVEQANELAKKPKSAKAPVAPKIKPGQPPPPRRPEI